MAQRGHTGEEVGQVSIGGFGKYGVTDFPRSDNNGRNDLGHHYHRTKIEGGIQGHWVGVGYLEGDKNYHKQPSQDVHISP